MFLNFFVEQNLNLNCSISSDQVGEAGDVSLHLMVMNNKTKNHTMIAGCGRHHGHWMKSNFYHTSVWNPILSGCMESDGELLAIFLFATRGLDANELQCVLLIGERKIRLEESLPIDELKGKCLALILMHHF